MINTNLLGSLCLALTILASACSDHGSGMPMNYEPSPTVRKKTAPPADINLGKKYPSFGKYDLKRFNAQFDSLRAIYTHMSPNIVFIAERSATTASVLVINGTNAYFYDLTKGTGRDYSGFDIGKLYRLGHISYTGLEGLSAVPLDKLPKKLESDYNVYFYIASKGELLEFTGSHLASAEDNRVKELFAACEEKFR
ncbi:hypothetical protein [Chitinophaga barathri]|uniref:Lipoprotein n=1 Tax=Chitinophaga barathri TaxID=1647451 RepID=A0A3N4M5A4_9BACT|nr:hypothetical protein [Chitinophaga barathri]RPD38188.1 hypothetical protein EG028_26375 [Chitinophaga barathri]